MNTAIAQHLNVTEEAILRVEEWASVIFTVVRGLGARFVSKKVVKMDLPKLEGTEKQVAWAEDIRNQILSDLDKKIEKNAKFISKWGDNPEAALRKKERAEKFAVELPVLQEVREMVQNANSAPAFIECRSADCTDFLESVNNFRTYTSPKAIECRDDREQQWQRISRNTYVWGLIGDNFRNN